MPIGKRHEHEHEDGDAVMTKASCEDKHTNLNRLNAAILGLLTLVFIACGWSITLTYSTSSAATTAAIEAKAVMADNKAQDIKIQDNWESSQRQIAAIRESMKEVQVTLKELNRDIINELRTNRELMQKLHDDHAKPGK